MPFTIVQGDLTKLDVDAIVNAANNDLAMGGGVCGAIFRAAGAARLQQACDSLAPIKTGEAVITPGFDLPARYVIHTAGPVYRGGNRGEAEQLSACYQNALQLAAANGCASIAFPLISSGIYGYPKEEALRVAENAIRDFLANNEMGVTLVVFDKASIAVSDALLDNVGRYLGEHYADARTVTKLRAQKPFFRQPVVDFDEVTAEVSFDTMAMPTPAQAAAKQLAEVRFDLDEPFSETLLRLIDDKGKTDVEVYKRANIDRRLFSKIRNGRGYMPGKRTVVALALALELSSAETVDLLRRAGYALSHSVLFDVIIEYFIARSRYDVFEINEVLFHYDQPLLGG